MIVLVVLAALVAFGCAAASTRRLYFATNPLALHPAPWLDAIERGDAAAAAAAAESDPRADWERELIDATADPDEEVRAGRINELMIDLDQRLTRWDRVPRVCASIASSAGFLFGSLMLRFGLVAAGTIADDAQSDAINAVVLAAVNVAAFGVAGAAFAIGAQYRARRAAKAYQRDIDALVQALETSKSTKRLGSGTFAVRYRLTSE